MKIRMGKKGDLKKISKLMFEYNVYENKLDKSVKITPLEEIEKTDKKYFDLGTKYIVIEEKKEIIGVLSFNIELRGIEKVGVLHTLIISEKERGKGYGKLLVQKVIDYFKKNECKRVRTFVHYKNKNAYSFWKSLGVEMEKGFFGVMNLK